MSNIFWHYTLKGKEQPPVSTEQLINMIKASEITRYEHVWHTGMKTWEPVGAHFDDHFALYQEKQPRFLKWGAVFAVIIGILIAINIALEPPVSGLMKTGLYLCFVGILYASIQLLRNLYILAKRLSLKKSKPFGTGLKVFTLCLTFGVGFTFYIQYQVMNTIVNTQAALGQMKNYTIAAIPPENPQVLNIQGTIGPGFSAELAGNLKAHKNIKIIRINSGGGLLSESLAAARAIEEHGNITTHATETCASGCIIVLLAANERWADHDMKLGFHGSSNIIGQNATEEEKKQNIYLRLADAYLEKRHVPQDVLNFKYSSTNTEFLFVEAKRLLASNTLTALFKDGKLIKSQAKLQSEGPVKRGNLTTQRAIDTRRNSFINQAPEGMPLEELQALNRLVNVFEKKIPEFNHHSYALEAAKNSADYTTMEMRKLMNMTRYDFAAEASPESALKHFNALKQQTVEYAKSNQWRRCAFYHDSISTFARENLNISHIPSVYHTYAAMAQSHMPEHKEVMKDPRIIPIFAQIAAVIDLTFKGAYSSITGTDDEKYEFGSCMANLKLIEIIENNPPEIQGYLAKAFFMDKLR